MKLTHRVAALLVLVAVLVLLWRGSDAEQQPTSPVGSGASHGTPSLPSIPESLALQTTADEGAGPTVDAVALRPQDALSGATPGTGGAHVTGFARDGRGAPLVGHRIEIQRPDTAIEASVTTGDDGGFRIEGLHSGSKVLRLLGPGEGDVPGALVDATLSGACQSEMVAEERRLNITLPPEGLDRMAVIVRAHDASVVRLRVVDDLGRPMRLSLFLLSADSEVESVDPLSSRLALARFGVDSAALELLSDPDGIICQALRIESTNIARLVFVKSSFQDRVGVAVVPELVGEAAAFSGPHLPVDLQLESGRVVQDLGTVMVPRMATLAVRLIDGLKQTEIYEATVVARCSGGGLPPSEEHGALDQEGRFNIWSQRSSGDYDLTIEAPGYRAVYQTGALEPGDEPRLLELTLEPLR